MNQMIKRQIIKRFERLVEHYDVCRDIGCYVCISMHEIFEDLEEAQSYLKGLSK